MADGEESIYNLIPRARVIPPKDPRYKSKVRGPGISTPPTWNGRAPEPSHPGHSDPIFAVILDDCGGSRDLGPHSAKPRPQLSLPPPRPMQHAKAAPGGSATMGAPKRAAATMGKPAGAVQPDPRSFMKSHARDVNLPPPKAPSQPKAKRNPPVPARAEKPTMGLVSSKNYITANAIEAILSQPKGRTGGEERWTTRKVTPLSQLPPRVWGARARRMRHDLLI